MTLGRCTFTVVVPSTMVVPSRCGPAMSAPRGRLVGLIAIVSAAEAGDATINGPARASRPMRWAVVVVSLRMRCSPSVTGLLVCGQLHHTSSLPAMILRLSSLFVRTLREDPADAEVPSHKLLVRAGYIRRNAPGI